MEGFDRKAIKNLAAKQTADTNAGKEVFFHTVVMLGVSLLIVLLDYMLTNQIGTTGGLAGLGTRSILETIRTVLQYANMLLVPFWEVGIVYWAIRRARGMTTGMANFLEGFRRFGPFLRLKLLQSIAIWILLMTAGVVSAMIFTFSPLARPLVQIITPYVQEGASMEALMMNEALIEQMMQHMYPAYIIMAVLLIPALLPLYYRFRMAEYALMEKRGTGAIVALVRSFQMTKKQFWNLMKLDLSYWWYGLLELVAQVLLYIELLLPLIGVAAPQGTALLLLNYGGYYGILLVIYTLFRGRRETTYALVYNILSASVPEKPQIIIRREVPWDPQ